MLSGEAGCRRRERAMIRLVLRPVPAALGRAERTRACACGGLLCCGVRCSKLCAHTNAMRDNNRQCWGLGLGWVGLGGAARMDLRMRTRRVERSGCLYHAGQRACMHEPMELPSYLA